MKMGTTPKTTKPKVSKPTTAKPKESAFMKAMKVSSELAAIVGSGQMPRTEVTKKIWDYIKKHKLQNPNKKTEICPDEKLSHVIGKKPINMFDMTKAISKHLS